MAALHCYTHLASDNVMFICIHTMYGQRLIGSYINSCYSSSVIHETVYRGSYGTNIHCLKHLTILFSTVGHLSLLNWC